MIFMKAVCLILAISYGFSNVGKVVCTKESVSDIQILLMSFGIVGYLYLNGWL